MQLPPEPGFGNDAVRVGRMRSNLLTVGLKVWDLDTIMRLSGALAWEARRGWRTQMSISARRGRRCSRPRLVNTRTE